ncbi:MAG: type IV secretory system conjugative DNA transfer family protein [Oscillospiraceae bacterium]|jgi:type IV secretory pathway TraG/TraD family ATPase VirD4|nr:type IV secretory system conjugative DNA transfer family protein [Oscillospiraceae bacterium]
MKTKTPRWLWLLPLPIVWWMALAAAEVKDTGGNLLDLLAKVSAPNWAAWTASSAKFLLLFTFGYAVGIFAFLSSRKNYRRGAEHGSARWGDVQEITRRYRDKVPEQNLILSQHFRLGLDGYRHKRNLNVLVIGGSGAGKSRSYAIPNVLQCNCSMVITDPKGEILRKTGNALKAHGYEVRVFDLINPDTSFCYNPLAYIRDDKDVLKLIENLIQSTTPPGSHSSDPFWVKSETALLQALVLYLFHEAPEDEQNFAMVMELLAAAQTSGNDDEDEGESPLDLLFARLEMKNPDHIAVKQYKIFKMAAGKTSRSILISTAVRLAAFNLPQIAKLTCTDELHLEELGERKTALFCCIPDADKSLNYLVGILYIQLIQTLYLEADRKHKGRLPVPVHLLIDEAPNISLPADSFLPSLATMRSRNIFCSYIAQNMAQIKAIFKEQWESLVGLCDEFLYLGGNEKETHKYVSELLGKETLDTNTYGQSRGKSGSYSVNAQQAGRELLTPDEVRMLDNSQAILFVRGERPMLDGKFNLAVHPKITLTEDGGAEPFDYAKAEDAADDLPFLPEQMDDLELLSMEDFLDD